MALTVWDALTFLPALGWILGKGVLAMFLGPLRGGRNSTKPYGVYVQRRIMHTLFTTLSVGQIQCVNLLVLLSGSNQ